MPPSMAMSRLSAWMVLVRYNCCKVCQLLVPPGSVAWTRRAVSPVVSVAVTPSGKPLPSVRLMLNSPRLKLGSRSLTSKERPTLSMPKVSPLGKSKPEKAWPPKGEGPALWGARALMPKYTSISPEYVTVPGAGEAGVAGAGAAGWPSAGFCGGVLVCGGLFCGAVGAGASCARASRVEG